jgi:hypothetical protein
MEERKLIQDYAREPNILNVAGVQVQIGMRGEAAGMVFVALQNVIEAVEQAEKIGIPAVHTERIRDEIRKAFA